MTRSTMKERKFATQNDQVCDIKCKQLRLKTSQTSHLCTFSCKIGV